MKKVLFFLLVLLMVPCIVFADSTYAQGTKKTDTYIYTYNDYARYIYVTGDLNYGFSGGKAVPVAEFKYGGFISQEEYSITNSGSYASWLAPGIQYWLIGKSKLDTRLLAGNDTDKSGVRITEYVLHDTKVTGAGTKTNPWVFVDGYSLKVGVSDNYVGTVSPTNGYEHVSPDDEAKVFGLKYDPKYSLDTSSCSAAVASVGGTFNITNGDSAGTKNITIGNVNGDVSCIINFGTDCLTVRFNNNGSGNSDGLQTKVFYYKYGKGWFGDSSCKTPLSITITSPTRTGYLFQGYKYRSNPSDTNGKVIVGPDNKIKPGIKDADVRSDTAFAIWKPVEYNITYNYNGGAGDGTYPSKGTYDSAVTIPNPKRTGYTFAGWEITGFNNSTAKMGDSSTVGSITTAITGKPLKKYYKNLSATQGATVSFKATWTANKYKITYKELTGATISSKPATGTYDSEITISNPTKTGYKFLGWTASNVNTSTAKHGASSATTAWTNPGDKVLSTKFKNLNPTDNAEVIFTAYWKAESYTVAYNCNGATSGSTANSTHLYDVSSNLRSNGCVKTGYNFKGWALTNSATTAKYGNGASVLNITAPGTVLTLYAVWKDEIKPTCTATKSNTGTVDGVTFKITCSDSGSGCPASSSFTKTGVKTTTSYTIRDNANNLGTCVGTVTAQVQKSTRSVHSERAGCADWGVKKCSSTRTVCGKCSAAEEAAARARGMRCSAGCYPETYTYNCPGDTCKRYDYRDVYGSWGSWSNVSSCTANDTTQCRTVYN